MSQALANHIRQQREELAHTYEQSLVAIAGGYEHLAPDELTQKARHDLELVAQALETKDPSPFLTSIRESTVARMAAGFDLHNTERLLQTLTAIEDVLFPHLDNLEDSRFLWQMMRQARTIAAIVPVQGLRDSELKYRQLIDRSPVGIFRTTPAGEIVEANPTFLKIVGYDSLQAINRVGVPGLYQDPADRERVLALLQRGSISGYETCFRRADGQIAPVSITVRTVEESEGQFLEGIIEDITERKQTEEALRESEELFRSVVENAHSGIFIVNQTFQFIYANDQVCQILGYPREELIGLDFRQVLDDESKQMVADRYDRRQRGEQVPPRYELSAIRKDGEKRQLEMSAVVIKDSAGNVQTVGQVLDITERKRAEAALRESERRYRQLIEEAGDVVYTISLRGHFTYVNPPAQKISGYSGDELIGMHFTDLIPEGWKSQVLSFYQQQLQEQMRETTLEFPFVTKGGEEKWVEQTVTLLTDGDSPTEFQCILRDITERKYLEQEIRESLERLSRQVQTSIEIAQDIAAATAPDQLFGRVVTLIKQRFGYYHVQIFRYDPQVNAVALVIGYGETGAKMLAARHRLKMGHGVVGTAAATGKPVLVSDVTQDPDWVPNPFLPETKGELAVPIIFRRAQEGEPQDQVLGILDVQSDTPGILTSEDQFLLEGLCGQIAIALESTRLRQETEERLQELDALYRATTRKGWQATRTSTPAYMYDSQTGLSPAPDLWMPPIQQALESGTPAHHQDVVAVPLLLRGQVVGTMGVYDDPEAPLSPDQVALIQSVAEQAAQAFEGARLFEEARNSAGELSILNEMSRSLSTLLDVEAVFESIYQYTSRLMDTSNFYIALYDPDSEEISFPLATDDGQQVQWRPRQLGKGLTEHVINTCEAVLIKENVVRWLKEHGIQAIGREAQSWLGVPMVVGQQVIGVIAVQSHTTPHLYDEHDQELLSTVASQAAITIERVRLFQETRSRAEELGVLNDLSQALSATLSVEQVLDETYRGVSRLLDATNFFIGLYDPVRNKVVFPFNVTESKVDKEIEVISADEGITGYIIRNRTSLLIEENVNQWFEEIGLDPIGQNAACFLGVPLTVGEWVLGVMAIQSYTTPRLYDEHDRDLLTTIAGQAAIALQNARMFEQTQTRARREQLIREINARVSRSMDLDTVLKTTARELSQALGVSHAVIRLGAGSTEPFLADTPDGDNGDK